MRRLVFLALFGAFLGACDGGSAAVTLSGALQGVIYEVDGQTTDRSGVEVMLLETGDRTTTDADGNFVFEDLAEGLYTLDVVGAILAQAGGDDFDNDEDGAGRPMVEVDRDNGVVSVHLAVRDGRVVEWSLAHRKFQRATMRLEATDAGDGLEGKVRVESRADRERIKVCVEGLQAGDVIDVAFAAPADTPTFTSAGTATADAEGEACFDRDTKQGDTLPEGATSVADLEGYLIQVSLGGTVVLEGEVPPLPEPPSGDRPGNGNGNGNGNGRPDFDGRGRGRVFLDSAVDGVTGKLEICGWPAKDRQRFQIVVEGLTEGDEVTFQIEDPDNAGSYLDLGTDTADAEGEANYDTHKAALPLDAESVDDLVGLDVRVLLGGEAILTGTVPEPIGY
jgi:hypothetical protein